MQDVRSFSLGFFVGTGSGDEPASRQGISHFLEHVLFKRTRRRSNVQIARAIDRLGGDVDAFTTKEYTGFYVHTLDARFPRRSTCSATSSSRRPSSAVDIEVERGVILEEIGEANDNPDDLVHEIFVRVLLAEPSAGRADPRKRRDGRAHHAGATSTAYYRARYAPDNLIVSVAGHVRAARVASRVERALPAPRRPRASPRRRPERRVRAPAATRTCS